MKSKLLLMVALSAVTFTVHAQTEKGNKILGGSLSFLTVDTKQTNANTKQNEFSIGPKFGYFIGRNFAVGIDASYSLLKSSSSYIRTTAANGNYDKNLVTESAKNQNTNLGAFARYYIDITERLKFFSQFNANVGFGKIEQTNAIPIDNTNYNMSISPSIAFFPVQKLAIELGFGLISYQHADIKFEENISDNYSIDIFNFGFKSFSPSLGVNFHF